MINCIKAACLLTFLTATMVLSGGLLGGRTGMVYGFLAAGLVNFWIVWLGPGFVLSMYRAQLLQEKEAPEVFSMIQRLSEKAGIPMPAIYLLPSASANVFAVGCHSKRAAIAVTHGIVKLLNENELEGVFSHELFHIKHRDILISTVVATLTGALGSIVSLFQGTVYWKGSEPEGRQRAHPLIFLIISAFMLIIAGLIRFSIFRAREYQADQKGTELCENPLYLASALQKIDAASKQTLLRDAQPATAHLFIINPLSSQGWLSLFNTHPSVEERIVRLSTIFCDQETPLDTKGQGCVSEAVPGHNKG